MIAGVPLSLTGSDRTPRLSALGSAKLSATALYTNRTNVTSSTHNLGCTDLVDVSLDRPEIAVPDDLSVPLLSPHERGGGTADRDGPGNQSLESGTEHQAARVPRRREMSCDWLNQLVQEHEVEMAKYNVKFDIRTYDNDRRALAGTHSGYRSMTSPRPAGRRRACSVSGLGGTTVDRCPAGAVYSTDD